MIGPLREESQVLPLKYREHLRHVLPNLLTRSYGALHDLMLALALPNFCSLNITSLLLSRLCTLLPPSVTSPHLQSSPGLLFTSPVFNSNATSKTAPISHSQPLDPITPLHFPHGTSCYLWVSWLSPVSPRQHVSFRRTGASPCSPLQTWDLEWSLTPHKHSSNHWMNQSTCTADHPHELAFCRQYRINLSSLSQSKCTFIVEACQSCWQKLLLLPLLLLLLLLIVPITCWVLTMNRIKY